MVKEIERVGIVVVYICIVVLILFIIGVNRIVLVVGILYLFGNFMLGEEESKKIRKNIVLKVLNVLIEDIEE